MLFPARMMQRKCKPMQRKTTRLSVLSAWVIIIIVYFQHAFRFAWEARPPRWSHHRELKPQLAVRTYRTALSWLLHCCHLGLMLDAMIETQASSSRTICDVATRCVALRNKRSFDPWMKVPTFFQLTLVLFPCWSRHYPSCG